MREEKVDEKQEDEEQNKKQKNNKRNVGSHTNKNLLFR